MNHLRVLGLLILLVYSGITTAHYDAKRTLPSLYKTTGVILSFCRTSTDVCQEVETFGNNGSRFVALELTINGKTYRGIPDACATSYHCRDMFVTASQNLKKALEADFPDVIVGDWIGKKNSNTGYTEYPAP